MNPPHSDEAHHELIQLLAAARKAVDADDLVHGLSAFEQLLERTIRHFATEERWMGRIGLQPDNAHAIQHGSVLAFIREVIRRARSEQSCRPLAAAVDGLAEWFPLHTQAMDGELATAMVAAGFDPAADG